MPNESLFYSLVEHLFASMSVNPFACHSENFAVSRFEHHFDNPFAMLLGPSRPFPPASYHACLVCSATNNTLIMSWCIMDILHTYHTYIYIYTMLPRTLLLSPLAQATDSVKTCSCTFSYSLDRIIMFVKFGRLLRSDSAIEPINLDDSQGSAESATTLSRGKPTLDDHPSDADSEVIFSQGLSASQEDSQAYAAAHPEPDPDDENVVPMPAGQSVFDTGLDTTPRRFRRQNWPDTVVPERMVEPQGPGSFILDRWHRYRTVNKYLDVLPLKHVLMLEENMNANIKKVLKVSYACGGTDETVDVFEETIAAICERLGIDPHRYPDAEKRSPGSVTDRVDHRFTCDNSPVCFKFSTSGRAGHPQPEFYFSDIRELRSGVAFDKVSKEFQSVPKANINVTAWVCGGSSFANNNYKKLKTCIADMEGETGETFSGLVGYLDNTNATSPDAFMGENTKGSESSAADDDPAVPLNASNHEAAMESLTAKFGPNDYKQMDTMEWGIPHDRKRFFYLSAKTASIRATEATRGLREFPTDHVAADAHVLNLLTKALCITDLMKYSLPAYDLDQFMLPDGHEVLRHVEAELQPAPLKANRLEAWVADHKEEFLKAGLKFDPDVFDHQRYGLTNTYYNNATPRERSIIFFFDETSPNNPGLGELLETSQNFPVRTKVFVKSVGCLTRRLRLWDRSRKRWLVGAEAMALQGIPLCMYDYKSVTNAQLFSLAGAAYNMDIMCALLVAFLATVPLNW